MAEHLISSPGDELKRLVADVQEYEVEVYITGDRKTPAIVLRTVGGWNIEGNFLCVYRDGIKEGYVLPLGVTHITVVPVTNDLLNGPYPPIKDDVVSVHLSSLPEPINPRGAVPIHDVYDPMDENPHWEEKTKQEGVKDDSE